MSSGKWRPFCLNVLNTMAAVALVPWVARTSIATVLTVLDDRVIVFPNEWFRHLGNEKLQWNLSITITLGDTSLPSGAHLGGQGPPRRAPEGRQC